MKLLYTTDLHGCEWKYERIVAIAQTEKADILINGGDMLPKEGDLHSVQLNFIANYLPGHLEHLSNAGIRYLCCLSNDDLAAHDGIFSGLCAAYPLVHNIAQQKQVIGGYEFIGFNLVTDYPFRLKDRCRMDFSGSKLQPQLGTGLLSRSGGFEEISDWEEYVRGLRTIEQELASLPAPSHTRPVIYVIHMPPCGLGLDQCASGFEAGSNAVHDFLKHHQPLLSLHGHIHESPQMSGKWKGQIGETVCMQPGQERDLVYVVIDLDGMAVSRFSMPR
jgi:Icc-related predicted phosphoesterase